jgi:serine/threonine protein kinase/tetratricopeptide (TPR) repeat protein
MIAGRFEPREFIAQGGMGAVYKGIDHETGQPVAIKQLKRDLIDLDETLIQRFQREGEALARLNHPNIVKMIAALEDAGEHYLVMDYISGGSLRDQLKREGALPVERVITLGVELADALVRAHHLKIIHRDIKPDNVLLADDGTPRLTDFGLAYVGGSHLTSFGVAPGTFSYLAPEAFADQPIEPRNDLWSFGVLLFELLTGRHPFEANTLEGTMSAILTRPVPDLEALRPELPVALVDLIYRLLEKDKNHRLPSARMLGAELDALAKGTPLAVTPSATRPISSGLIRSQSMTSHNLPSLGTAFIGREQELTDVTNRLSDPLTQLISILGIGGIGKTRLAIEAARNLVGEFTHGVWFIDLTPLSTPDRVLYALAEAIHLGIFPASDPKQQVVDYLYDKNMLLIFDNFEHVLGAAGLIAAISANAPGVKMLVTSRERLNLTNEQVYQLEGLTVPADDQNTARSAAVRLFVQGAVRVRPEFHLDPENIPIIVKICRQVSGIPLAILLSAAWVESLSVAEIEAELSQNSDLLETELRDVPERQRSIRAIFDYSWQRLTPPEQQILKQLTMFRGGFNRDAATRITGASLKTLNGLVVRSLIRRAGSGRYEIHELVRQYAAQHLTADPVLQTAAAQKHHHYYVRLLAEQMPLLKGANQKTALLWIEAELENLRAAWERLEISTSDEMLADALFSLWYYYYFFQHPHEAAVWFAAAERALQAHVPHPMLESLCATYYAFVKWQLAHYEEAAALWRKAEQIAAQHPEAAWTHTVHVFNDFLNVLVVMRFASANAALYARQQHLLEQVRADTWNAALVQLSLCDTAYRMGDLALGQRHSRETLDLAEETGDALLLGWTHALIGHLLTEVGRYQESVDAGHAAEAIFDSFGLRQYAVRHLFTLSRAYANLGNLSRAEFYAQQVLENTHKTGNRVRRLSALALLSSVAWSRRDFAKARDYSLQTLQIAKQGQSPQLIGGALISAAHAMVELHEYGRAWGYYVEAIPLVMRLNDLPAAMDALVGLGYLLALQGALVKGLAWILYITGRSDIQAETREVGGWHAERLREQATPAELEAATNLATGLSLPDMIAAIPATPPNLG